MTSPSTATWSPRSTSAFQSASRSSPDLVEREHRLDLGAVARAQRREAELAGVADEDDATGDRDDVAGRGVGLEVGVRRAHLRRSCGSAGRAPGRARDRSRAGAGASRGARGSARGRRPRDLRVPAPRRSWAQGYRRDEAGPRGDNVRPMSGPTFDERKLSFGADAANYAAFRPGFPPEAARWILDGRDPPGRRRRRRRRRDGRVHPRPRGPRPAGLGVRARSRDARRARARAARRAPPRRDGGAPARSPTRASTRVTVAQAWHWFDKPAAGAEFLRVVRPGGVIGLLWNVRDDAVGWMARDVRHRRRRGLDAGQPGRRATPRSPRCIPEVERADFAHTVAMTPEDVVRLASTFSYVRLRPDRDAVYADAPRAPRHSPGDRRSRADRRPLRVRDLPDPPLLSGGDGPRFPATWSAALRKHPGSAYARYTAATAGSTP